MLTDGIRETVYNWTGSPQGGCPWRAFHDPFVSRVLKAYAWFESGQLDTREPNASHRLVEGVSHYHSTAAICRSKRMQLDAEKRKKAGRS